MTETIEPGGCAPAVYAEPPPMTGELKPELTMEALAKAALDINTYASHDDDCESNMHGTAATDRHCSCGFIAASKAVLDLADRAVFAPNPQWKPIASAPRDGTAILTYRGVGLLSVAVYAPPLDKSFEWCCTDGIGLLNVTHWQALPPPPSLQQNGGG